MAQVLLTVGDEGAWVECIDVARTLLEWMREWETDDATLIALREVLTSNGIEPNGVEPLTLEAAERLIARVEAIDPSVRIADTRETVSYRVARVDGWDGDYVQETIGAHVGILALDGQAVETGGRPWQVFGEAVECQLDDSDAFHDFVANHCECPE